MNLFKKETEELKNSFSENVKEIMHQSKLIVFVVTGATCLITGFIMGAVTTGAMCRTLSATDHR